jgi:pilus assembly protein Flp/PilA
MNPPAVAASSPARGHSAGSSEVGASAVEYGLLISGIAAVIAVAVYLFGGTVLGLFEDTCDTFATHAGSASC